MWSEHPPFYEPGPPGRHDQALIEHEHARAECAITSWSWDKPKGYALPPAGTSAIVSSEASHPSGSAVDVGL